MNRRGTARHVAPVAALLVLAVACVPTAPGPTVQPQPRIVARSPVWSRRRRRGAPPPITNTPPREGEDPHGKIADVPEALAIVVSFLDPTRQIIDVCGGDPCQGLP